MLEFDEKFFQGEVIDDFYVEGDMKRAWAAQMEVLVEIDRICKKYDIQYFAEYGTLLGAVRHKGFIPWDDDMDISMKREDYLKFMKVAPSEIPSGWYLFAPQLVKTWRMPFMRINNGIRIDIRKEHLERFHGCPYVVGIDIFPLDYFPQDEAELEVLKILYGHTIYVKNLIEKKDAEESEEEKKERENKIEEYLTQLEKDLRFKIDREDRVVNQLLRRLEDISVLYREDECKVIGVLGSMATGYPETRLKEWYDETILLPFENIMIPAPKEYDRVLKVIYGDYMVPVRGVAGHDYPFYKKQRERVNKMLENLQGVNEKLVKLEETL